MSAYMAQPDWSEGYLAQIFLWISICDSIVLNEQF